MDPNAGVQAVSSDGPRQNRGVRLGIAHHLGWAVAVTASADHQVVDRRRIELIEPGMPTAPIHHEGGPHLLHRQGDPLDDDALAALVADVRASAVRATSAAVDELATALPEPIVSISLRAWPADFPDDIATQRRVPYESRADSVMYRQVLVDLAHERSLDVHLYEAKDDVEAEAARVLGKRARRSSAAPGKRWAAMIEGPSDGARGHACDPLTWSRNCCAHSSRPLIHVLGLARDPGGPMHVPSACAFSAWELGRRAPDHLRREYPQVRRGERCPPLPVKDHCSPSDLARIWHACGPRWSPSPVATGQVGVQELCGEEGRDHGLH